MTPTPENPDESVVALLHANEDLGYALHVATQRNAELEAALKPFAKWGLENSIDLTAAQERARQALTNTDGGWRPKVRELVWLPHSHGDTLKALSPVGDYEVWERKGTCFVFRGGTHLFEGFGTIETAKTIAQKDCNNLVLSALDLPPTGEAG